MTDMEKLFSNFPKRTKAEWLAKVEKDLKGKPMDSLDWSPFDGLTMTPFFHPEDLPEPPPPLVGKREGNAWEIGEQIRVVDEGAANGLALEALDGGATALGFTCEHEIKSAGLLALLDQIDTAAVSLHFYFTNGAPQNFVAELCVAILAKKQNPAKAKGSVNLAPAEDLFDGREALPLFRFVHVPGNHFYQKNKPTEELAQVIASADKHLRRLKYEGMGFDEAVPLMQFSLAIGSNYFLAIAKIRALKLLWNRLAEGHGIKDVDCPPIEIHLAPDSQAFDPNANKISATTQAMAAIIGGAERLYLLPGDALENDGGTPFSRRIARNVQHILKLESYLDRVADPAAGSYFIENLTTALTERAWGVFLSS